VNRYLLFAGDRYYPLGGFKDFRGSFTVVEAAVEYGRNETDDFDWWHVVDLLDGTIVQSGTSHVYGN
jgi:hypothetical protein